jgi:eukaryotic-like serine/threonine-protein kinase
VAERLGVLHDAPGLGGTLAGAIAKTKTMTERLALLPHVVAVTEALAYAHAQRIIHRDLKPGNVLVGEFGETVVIDWGLAKELDHAIDDGPITEPDKPVSNPNLTRAGAVLGTPGFMSIEQATGEPIDERADVYALGAILYNVLTGVAPYYDKHGRDDSDRILEIGVLVPPTPIAQIAPEVPADLRVIVERAMARDKRDRYPTAKEMSEELRRFQAGKLIAREYGLGELLMRWVRRHRTAISVGGVALVALAVVGVVAFVNIGSSRDAEREARQTADTARVKAEDTVAALLEEQGRIELLQRDRERALGFLADAYKRGRSSVALSHMLADATRDLGLLEHSIDLASEPEAIEFTDDGELVVIDKANQVTRWRNGARIGAFSIAGRGSAYIDPHARSVGFVSGKQIAMWDVETGTERWKIDGEGSEELVFDAAGKRVAVMPSYMLVGVHGLPQVRDVATGDLVATLSMPGRQIVNVAFGLSDEVAVSEHDSNVIQMWKLTPQLRPVVRFDPDDAFPGAMSPRLVVSGGADLGFASSWRPEDPRIVVLVSYEARLWEVDGKTASFRSLANHGRRISRFALSPDGELIATADGTGVVRLTGLDGAAIAAVHDIEGAVHHLEFAGNGSVLVGVGADERVYVWDAVSLDLRQRIDAHDSIEAVTLDRTSTRLATAGDKRVRVWRVPTGNRIARVESRAIAVTPTRWVNATNRGLTAHALDSGAPIHEAASDRAFGGEMRVSRDGTRVVELERRGALVFDPTTKAGLGAVREIAMPGRPRMSADGRYLVAVGETDQRPKEHVIVIDAASGATVLDVAFPDSKQRASGYDIAPDGSRIVVAFGTEIQEWKLPSGDQRKFSLAHPHAQFDVRFDPSGKWLAAFDAGALALFDSSTGALVQAFDTRLTPADVTFSASGQLLALRTDRTNRVEVWTRDGRRLLRADASAYAFSADATRFATGTEDGAIRIWELAGGRQIARLAGHTQVITALAFSADGTRLVAHSDDKFASLWDVHLEQRTPAQINDLVK